ncbi:hypothetical protein RJT34_30460 [Clitoria ternatea]|uniref:Uncharacterized protein n=1 Tax=Clitoria ternatea TaxID=43366 RepID=A0AAN9ETH4_CLITE
MFRSMSTRRGPGGKYERLGKETVTTALLNEGLKRSTSLPSRVSNSSRKMALGDINILQRNPTKKANKSDKKSHPLLSFLDLRRKKKTTAKPEFARYLEYLKEGGMWDLKSNKPVRCDVLSPSRRRCLSHHLVLFTSPSPSSFFSPTQAMPTFTAIAFDRLIEPGGSKPAHKSGHASMPVPRKLERRSSEPTVRKKLPPRPQLKPALYATPEVKPLPDTPSSFPPSPYIINHKRRGPRLQKSFSEANVQANQKVLDDKNASGKSCDVVVAGSTDNLQVGLLNPEAVVGQQVNSPCDTNACSSNGSDLEHGHWEGELSSIANGSLVEKVVASGLERDDEIEDFFDPHDSMSVASSADGDDNTGTGRSMKFHGGEFFDAWEELSSEGGTQFSQHDVEAELRDIRLSLLMEIEKRKQVEESLNNMQSQWGRIRQELSLVGIVLPADLTAAAEGESDPVEDIYQQVYIARFISNTIGRGTARAELECEMEAQLELKNFEIARLLERLHFYETVNREMSQRNQEAVEMARRERQRRCRRQRWIWGSITTAVAIGTAALAWSYLPTSKGSTSTDHDLVHKHDDAAAN